MSTVTTERPAATPPISTPGGAVAPRVSRRSAVLREVRRRPLYASCALVLIGMVSLAIIGPLLPLHDPTTPVLSDRLLSPLSRGASGELYLLGTDHLGRDVLARLVTAAQVTVGIAAAVTMTSAILGTTLGLLSGYRGGFTDHTVMRLVDLQLAFPPLLMMMFAAYVFGQSLLVLIILLSVMTWVGFARMTRAQSLSLRAQPFVDAAVAAGASPSRIVVRHVLPQMTPLLAMIAVLDFGTVMLAEAGLSFIGLGVQPPHHSWGSMVNDGREFVSSGAWWLFLAPGLAIFITVFAANMTSRWAQQLLGMARPE